MEFKVGDRVKVTVDCSGCVPGDVYIVFEHNGYLYVHPKGEIESMGQSACSCQYSWIKQGETMSLRKRIEALNNGWDKEADDILGEIQSKVDNCEYVRVSAYYQKEKKELHNKITVNLGSTQESFNYTSQCSKMTAFKDALLWLLDKSGLEGRKKGDTIKIESEGKTYKVKIIEEC